MTGQNGEKTLREVSGGVGTSKATLEQQVFIFKKNKQNHKRSALKITFLHDISRDFVKNNEIHYFLFQNKFSDPSESLRSSRGRNSRGCSAREPEHDSTSWCESKQPACIWLSAIHFTGPAPFEFQPELSSNRHLQVPHAAAETTPIDRACRFQI